MLQPQLANHSSLSSRPPSPSISCPPLMSFPTTLPYPIPAAWYTRALPPPKRRRTATSVLSGEFDPRPPRDILTSLLNGVPAYKPIEGDEGERKLKRLERKERERERRRQKRLHKSEQKSTLEPARKHAAGQGAPLASGRSTPSHAAPTVNSSTSSFWRTRGPAVEPTRSISPSPPPELYSPPTPGRSVTSTVSRLSSKRPYTPDDEPSLPADKAQTPPVEKPIKVRKKRQAARKGWKGWVEGSPPISEKLINLDSTQVMHDRRLRSGKNFDAISEGHDTWVNPGMGTFFFRRSKGSQPLILSRRSLRYPTMLKTRDRWMILVLQVTKFFQEILRCSLLWVLSSRWLLFLFLSCSSTFLFFGNHCLYTIVLKDYFHFGKFHFLATPYFPS